MNIMNRLTKKHMLANKKRTIMTILGVIISVAMITAVSTASSTFTDLLQRMAMNTEGAYHVQYVDFPVDNIPNLEHEKTTKDAFYTQYLAYGQLKDKQINNEYKPYIYIEKFTQDAMNMMSLELIDGRFPNSENEIALPEHLASNGGVIYKVGDSITMDLGDRYVGAYSEGFTLNQYNPYTIEDTEKLDKEQLPDDFIQEKESFMVKENATYTVVGIIARPNFENFSAPGYTAITYLNIDKLAKDETVNAFVFSNQVNKGFYSNSKNIATKYGVSEWNIKFNDRVLRYYGISQYDNFNRMINRLALILISIIMLGSVSLIYNSFAISITERSKQFGMLASVGATRQQKRNAIFYEGSVIGLIAIPLGILAGILGMFVTFQIVGPMLTNSVGIDVPLKMKVSLASIFVAIVFSILTIFISALIPAKRASRISPLEAIRQTKDIKLSKKRVKSSKLTKLFFGIEGDIAQKNLKRNRKRYRALVFSLFISLILFISVGSYTFYLSKAFVMTAERSNYDLSMYFDSRYPIEDERAYDEILNRIKHVDGVIEGTKLIHSPLSFTFDEAFVKQKILKDFIEAKKIMYRSWGLSEDEIQKQANDYSSSLYVEIVALDDTAYTKFLNELDSTSSETKPDNDIISNGFPGILINMHQHQAGYSLMESEVLNLDNVQDLTIYYQSYEEMKGDNLEIQYVEKDRVAVPISLAAVTTKVPMGLSYASVGSAMRIVVSESTYKTMYEYVSSEEDPNINTFYYYNISTSKGIEERIKEALGDYAPSLFIRNRFEDAQQDKQLMTVMSIFAYGFITLISLICMTNLCNTIATSFALRRREFAMLKSVGMTPKTFHRMIRYESLLYGIKSLLYGLPISLFITYKIFQVVNSNFTSGFVFPWATYVIGILSVFIVVGVAMAYSTFKVRNESIIDGLKSEIE